MSDFVQNFSEEITKRFPVISYSEKAGKQEYTELGRRYAETFLHSPEVAEAAPNRKALVDNAVIHCFHAGVIVALYERTEEDYEISEKTFAVLTNMDTVFFSGLMFTRWNVKKRCVNYKTDETAQKVWQLLCSISKETQWEDDSLLITALALVFLAGAAIEPAALENPQIDMAGLD